MGRGKPHSTLSPQVRAQHHQWAKCCAVWAQGMGHPGWGQEAALCRWKGTVPGRGMMGQR